MSRSILWFALLIVCFSLVGCGGSKPSRFYMMSPIAGSQELGTKSIPEGSLRVGLYPILVAEYLKRPQIVRRAGSHQLEVAEFDLWAEPIEDAIGSVMATNLGYLLGEGAWVEFPYATREEVRFEVKVELFQLDVDAAGTITLESHSEIFRGGEKTPVAQWTTHVVASTQIENPKDEGYYNDVVSGMSDLIEDLSEEIAEQILALR